MSEAPWHRRWACEHCGSRFLRGGRHHCRLCGSSVCEAHFVRPLCTRCHYLESQDRGHSKQLTPHRTVEARIPLTPSPTIALSRSLDDEGWRAADVFPVMCCLVATVCCLSVHKPSVGILVTTVAAFGLGMLAGVVASTRRHKARALRTESPPPFSTNLNYSQPPLASPAVSPRSIEGYAGLG